MWPTSTACVEGSGKAGRNLDVRSTTTTRYQLPLIDATFILDHSEYLPLLTKSSRHHEELIAPPASAKSAWAGPDVCADALEGRPAVFPLAEHHRAGRTREVARAVYQRLRSRHSGLCT